MLKHGILGLLSYNDMTGYELMEMFRDSLSHFWNAQTSQIYRELQSMEKLGWVESTVLEQKGKPDKRRYHLTESGRTEFYGWMDNGDIKLKNDPVMMKVFFLAEREPQLAINYFNIIRERNQKYLVVYNQVINMIDAIAKAKHSEDRAVYWRMTLDYGIRLARLNVEWCDDNIRQIKERYALEDGE